MNKKRILPVCILLLSTFFSFAQQGKTVEGQLPIHVDGYCTSFDNHRDNLKTATVRAKSELIVKKGLKEENFITAIHAENQDGGKEEVVVVSFLFKEVKEAGQSKPEEKPQSESGQQPAIPAVSVVETHNCASLQIHTNLLYWAVATPNLGIEYKPSGNLGILVNGSFSHWIWSDEGKHHRTWLVQPEVRYYLGESKQWFLGIEGHAGEFNFKFGDTGYQGDITGGGITGGYRLRLSKCFDMDFSLGLGYTQLKYDTYYRSNDVMVRKEGGLEKNVFTPTQAGISLIWKIK